MSMESSGCQESPKQEVQPAGLIEGALCCYSSSLAHFDDRGEGRKVVSKQTKGASRELPQSSAGSPGVRGVGARRAAPGLDLENRRPRAVAELPVQQREEGEQWRAQSLPWPPGVTRGGCRSGISKGAGRTREVRDLLQGNSG